MLSDSSYPSYDECYLFSNRLYRFFHSHSHSSFDYDYDYLYIEYLVHFSIAILAVLAVLAVRTARTVRTAFSTFHRFTIPPKA